MTGARQGGGHLVTGDRRWLLCFASTRSVMSTDPRTGIPFRITFGLRRTVLRLRVFGGGSDALSQFKQPA